MSRIRQARELREEGFTLIELLIVIVVLGILAGIVVFGVGTFRKDAQDTACQATLKTVNVAADAYNAKVGTYPTTIDVLLPDAGPPPVPGYLKSAPDTSANGTGALTFNAGTQTVTAANCTLP